MNDYTVQIQFFIWYVTFKYLLILKRTAMCVCIGKTQLKIVR